MLLLPIWCLFLLQFTLAPSAEVTVTSRVEAETSYPLCWILKKDDGNAHDFVFARDFFYQYYSYGSNSQYWSTYNYWQNTIRIELDEACSYGESYLSTVEYECFGKASGDSTEEDDCDLEPGNYYIIVYNTGTTYDGITDGQYEISIGGARLLEPTEVEDLYHVANFTVDPVWTDPCSGSEDVGYNLNYESDTGLSEAIYISPNYPGNASKTVDCLWLVSPVIADSGGTLFDSIWVTFDTWDLEVDDEITIYDGDSTDLSDCLYSSTLSGCSNETDGTVKSTGGTVTIVYGSNRDGNIYVDFEIEGSFCLDSDCSGNGICEYGECVCDSGWEGEICYLPAAWECSKASYNSSDGCDCNCGAYDPDCPEVSSSIVSCNESLWYLEDEMWEFGAIDDGWGGYCTFCYIPEDQIAGSVSYPTSGASVCNASSCLTDEVCDSQSGLCITPEDTYVASRLSQHFMVCDANGVCPDNLYCGDDNFCVAVENEAVSDDATFRVTTTAGTCAFPFDYPSWQVNEGSCTSLCDDGAYGFDYSSSVRAAQENLEAVFSDNSLNFYDDECKYISSKAAIVNIIAEVEASCSMVSFEFSFPNGSTSAFFEVLEASAAVVTDVVSGEDVSGNVTSSSLAFAFCLGSGNYTLTVNGNGGGWEEGQLDVAGRGQMLLENATVAVGMTTFEDLLVCDGTWVTASFEFKTYYKDGNKTTATGEPKFNLTYPFSSGKDLVGQPLVRDLPKSNNTEVHTYCLPAGESFSVAVENVSNSDDVWYFKLTETDFGGEALIGRGMLGISNRRRLGAFNPLSIEKIADRDLISCSSGEYPFLLNMTDTWGDGWGDTYYTVSRTSGMVATGGLADGYQGADWLCLADGCHVVEVSYDEYYEAEWSICGSDYYPSDYDVTICVNATGGYCEVCVVECDITGLTEQEEYALYYDEDDFNGISTRVEMYETASVSSKCSDTTVYAVFDWMTFQADYYSEASFYIKNQDTNSLYDVLNAEMTGLAEETYSTYAFCLESGNYRLYLVDSWGDGWAGGYFHLYQRSAISFGEIEEGSYTFVDGSSYTVDFTIEDMEYDIQVSLDWEECSGAELTVYMDWEDVSWGSEASFIIYNPDNTSTDAHGNSMEGYAPEYGTNSSYTYCLGLGTYRFLAMDSYGDGWDDGDGGQGNAFLSYIYAGKSFDVPALTLNDGYSKMLNFTLSYSGPAYTESDAYPTEASFAIYDVDGNAYDLDGNTMEGEAEYGLTSFYYTLDPSTSYFIYLYDEKEDGWGGGTYSIRYKVGSQYFFLKSGTLHSGASDRQLIYFRGDESLVSQDVLFLQSSGTWGLDSADTAREHHGCGCTDCNQYGFNMTVAEQLARQELGGIGSAQDSPYSFCNMLNEENATASFHFTDYGKDIVVNYYLDISGEWQVRSIIDEEHLGPYCYQDSEYTGECVLGKGFSWCYTGKAAALEEATCAMYDSDTCSAIPDQPYRAFYGELTGGLIAGDLACSTVIQPEFPSVLAGHVTVVLSLDFTEEIQSHSSGFLDLKVYDSAKYIVDESYYLTEGDLYSIILSSNASFRINSVLQNYGSLLGRTAAFNASYWTEFNANHSDMVLTSCSSGPKFCLEEEEGLVVFDRDYIYGDNDVLPDAVWKINVASADSIHFKVYQNNLWPGEALSIFDTDGSLIATITNDSFSSVDPAGLLFDSAEGDYGFFEADIYPETVSAWVKVENNGDSGKDMVLLSDGDVTWGIAYDGTPVFHWYGQSWYGDGSLSEVYLSQTWQYVTFVRLPDAGIVQFLIDGRPLESCAGPYVQGQSCSKPNLFTFLSRTPTDGLLYVGANPSASSTDYQITLDEMALFTRRIYPSEIRNLLWNGTHSCNNEDVGLLACFHFDENFKGMAGEEAEDKSMYEHDLSVFGATSAAGVPLESLMGTTFASSGSTLTLALNTSITEDYWQYTYSFYTTTSYWWFNTTINDEPLGLLGAYEAVSCDCSGHGSCERGFCVCEAGWGGQKCSKWLVSTACSSDSLGVVSTDDEQTLEILAGDYREWAEGVLPAVSWGTAQLPDQLNCSWGVSYDHSQAMIYLNDLNTCEGELLLQGYDGIIRQGDIVPDLLISLTDLEDIEVIEAQGGELTVKLSSDSDLSCADDIAGEAIRVDLKAYGTSYVAASESFVKNDSALEGLDVNPYLSLQDAVDAASAGDIILLYPGRYEIMELSITIPLTLKGMSGSGYTIFDANYTNRAAYIFTVGDVTFEGISFIHGSANEGSVIYAKMGDVHLYDCVFEKNEGIDSGSVHIVGPASLVVENSQFMRNTADNGAGITADGAYIKATNISFTHNSASYFGGAIYLMSSSGTFAQGELFDCDFEKNTAGYGGAMFLLKGIASMTGIHFEYNSADARGGGIGANSYSSISCDDCEFTSNDANRGAAAYIAGNSSLSLTNSQIYENEDNALYISESTTSLSHCNIFENNDYSGSFASSIFGYDSFLSMSSCSVYSHQNSDSPAVHLEKSGAIISEAIFLQNSADAGAALYLLNCRMNVHGGVKINQTLFSNNIASYSSGGAVYSEASAVTFVDSELSGNSASEHGGAIFIFDATDSEETAFEMYTTNISGNSAGTYGGAIHADEVSSASIWSSSFSNNAAGERGGSIWAIETGLVISDSQVLNSIAHGDYAGGVGIDFGSTGEFSGLSIQNCEAKLGGGFAAIGGSGFVMANSYLAGNQATQGGGITSEAFSTPVISDTIFSHNSASEDGGGVYVARIEPEEPVDPILKNCRFENNSAEDGIGGHVYLALADNIQIHNITGENSKAVAGAGISAMASEVALKDVHIHGTSAKQGAALYLIHSEITMLKSNFSRHSASESGAAIYTFQTQLNVTNSYFSENQARRGGSLFLFDSIARLETAIFERNIATDQGGALALLETKNLFAEYCVFESNEAGAEGGAIILDRSGAMIDHCLFESNVAGVEGAALFALDGLSVEVQASIFEGNAPALGTSGSGCGGAIHASSTTWLQVNGSVFEGNGLPLNSSSTSSATAVEEGTVSLNNGGAICVDCTATDVADTYFADNWGYMGGAVYSGEECVTESTAMDSRRLNSIKFVENSGMREYTKEQNASETVMVKNCTFEDNTATGGGGALYWANLPPAMLSMNLYKKNRALYGPTVAGPPAYIIPYHNGVQEKSGYTFRIPIMVHAKDVYNQTVRTENGAACFAQLNSGELEWKKDNPYYPTPNLQGDTLEEFIMGIAVFDEIVVEKYPDSYVNITFTAPSIVGNEALVPLYLRSCVRGEVLPEGSGTCIRCDPGSFSWDTNDTRCTECPVGAVCYGGDHIKSLQNYWHFVDSPGSYVHGVYYIHQCTNLDACIGDILLSTSADVEGFDIVFGEDTDLTDYASYWNDCVDEDGSYQYCYVNVEGETLRLADSTTAVQAQKIELYYNSSSKYSNKAVYMQREEACAANYAGNMCNNCAHGSGRSSGTKCASCVGGENVAIMFMVFGALAVAIAGGVMIKLQLDEDEPDNEKLSIMMKIFTSYMQMVSLFSAMSMSWPTTILYLFKAQNAVSSAGDAILSTDCALNYADVGISLFYQKLAFYMMVPPVIVIGCVVFWWSTYKLKALRLNKDWDFRALGLHEIADSGEVRIDQVKEILEAVGENTNTMRIDEIKYLLRLHERPAPLESFDEAFMQAYKHICKSHCTLSIVVLLFVVHPNISQYALEVFACKTYEQSKIYLVPDNDVECYTPEHYAWAFMVGLPGIIVYAIGIPVLAFFALHGVKDDLDLVANQLKYGFLYFGYSKKYYYWEVWVTLRKIVIVFITVFVSQSGKITEACSAIIVVGFTLGLHLQTLPYESKDLNDLETWGLYASVLTLVFGLYFLSGELNFSSKMFFIVMILFVNLGYCVYFCVVAFNDFKEKVFETLRAVPVIKKYVPEPDNDETFELQLPPHTGNNQDEIVVSNAIRSPIAEVSSKVPPV